jgi:hypothetical protein
MNTTPRPPRTRRLGSRVRSSSANRGLLQKAATFLLLSLAFVALPSAPLHADGPVDLPPRPTTRSDVLRWLSRLPAADHGQQGLAVLFANGTAEQIPLGRGNGYPVLSNTVPELSWFGSQLWGGKTFKVVAKDANGQPVVRLDNMIIRTETGGLVNLFDAYVTRGVVGQTWIGVNSRGEEVKPPTGTLAPVAVSLLSEGATIDDKPSIILNYFEDKTLPIIRRILDEIREIDASTCPGLYLGRAHARGCTSMSCGEVPDLLVDKPASFSLATQYKWGFWTYFLLDFGGDKASCDIASAIAHAEQQLSQGGQSVQLPEPPVVR